MGVLWFCLHPVKRFPRGELQKTTRHSGLCTLCQRCSLGPSTSKAGEPEKMPDKYYYKDNHITEMTPAFKFYVGDLKNKTKGVSSFHAVNGYE